MGENKDTGGGGKAKRKRKRVSPRVPRHPDAENYFQLVKARRKLELLTEGKTKEKHGSDSPLFRDPVIAAAARMRASSLRWQLKEALRRKVTPDILESLRERGIDVDDVEGVTFGSAIAAKVALQALESGRAGDKAVDQLIAMEPKELHLDEGPIRPSVSASMLSRLTPEQLEQLRAIRATLKEAADEDTEVRRPKDVTPKGDT